MIYLIFLLVSCLYLRTLGYYKDAKTGITLAYCFPILLFWTLLIGGQYAVGTDYFSYMEIFNGVRMDYIESNRGEYLFSYLIRSLNFFNIYGQLVFLFIALIWALLLFYIMKSGVKNRYLYVFLFVFVVFSGIFNNQMNGIRQYLAVYVFTSGACLFIDGRKIIGMILMFICGFIHTTAFIFFPLFFIFLAFGRLFDKTKSLQMILIIGIVLSFILNTEMIGKVVPIFKVYSNYLDTELVGERSFLLKLTKYWYIPLFFFAIKYKKEMKLNRIQDIMFYLGLVGFSFKLALVNLKLFSRFSEYMEFFACFPLVYLIIYMGKKRKQYSLLITYIYLLAPYALKVTALSTGEYSYNFFLFN